MSKAKLVSSILSGSVILFNPANRAVEALVHHGYTEVGGVEISMPLLHETEEVVETVEVTEIANTNPNPTEPEWIDYDLTKPTKGMKVLDGTVTSPQGWRTHPVYGTRRMHNGVDWAKSKNGGEPLYAPGKIEVECLVDNGGGGHYALFFHNQMWWQLLHLQPGSCVPGGHEKGWVIGKIGSSGIGTGPHLHLGLRHPDYPKNRTFLHVGVGHLEAVLKQGN